jgi:nucleoredoxin
LGSEFVTSDDAKVDLSHFKGKNVGLYFSAHWCPPCRGFTPELARIYRTVSATHPFEIIFISSDKNEGEFNEYRHEMPWISLPFADRDRKAALSKKYGVRGIPSLVLLDSNGNTITTEGRSAVTGNEDGFPWVPKTLSEIVGEIKTLRKPDGTTVSAPEALAGKVVAFYFSAHWCPPCKKFTPNFASVYNKVKAAGKDFEVVFVSGDKSEEEFDGYHGSMPWLALPFSDKAINSALNSHFQVEGIPTVCVVDSGFASVINKDCVSSISEDKEGTSFPWHPKPVNNVNGSPEGIEDFPSLVAFLEGCDDSEQEEAKAALTQFATKHFDDAKAAGKEPTFRFFYADESDGLSERLRAMTGQTGKSADALLVLIDIPDDGGYYVSKDKSCTSESLTAFLSGYASKSLERQQLGK